MTYSLTELNQMDQPAFTAALGSVFEDTPAIAHTAWHQRPFPTIKSLHDCMIEIVQSMSLADQLVLINAHPDLGSRVQMAVASLQEQSGAGLDRLTPEEYSRFQTLNQTYRTKFGFPFIMAVAGQTKEQILTAFTQRLDHAKSTEIQQALQEIGKIAGLRLKAWVNEP